MDACMPVEIGGKGRDHAGRQSNVRPDVRLRPTQPPWAPTCLIVDVTCANAACMHVASQNVGRWVGKNRRVTVAGPSPDHFPTAAHDLQCCFPKIKITKRPSTNNGCTSREKIIFSKIKIRTPKIKTKTRMKNMDRINTHMNEN